MEDRRTSTTSGEQIYNAFSVSAYSRCVTRNVGSLVCVTMGACLHNCVLLVYTYICTHAGVQLF